MYFIFDMDETLANTSTISYYIATLFLQETLSNKGILEFLKCRKIKIPNSLIKSLNCSYKNFVDGIIKYESTNKPLGILRPGILEVMRKLYKLQKEGKIKYVVIYSNNRQIGCVKFIRDLIHSYLGTKDLIKDCIHVYNKLRIVDIGNKSWDEIKHILINGKCKAPKNIDQNKVYFFDNYNYVDFYNNISNFYNVPSYNYNASFDRVSNIYRQSICNVNNDLYIKYMKHLLGEKNTNNRPITNIEDIIEIFKSRSNITSNISEGSDTKIDYGINMMHDAINDARKKSKNNTRKKLKSVY